MICVPIVEKDTELAIEASKLAKELGADLVELRIDHLDNPKEGSEIIKNLALPTIATCRPMREKGKYRGSEEDRIKILEECSDEHAEYVDVENSTEKNLTEGLFEVAKENKTKTILSHHDYKKTPNVEKLLEIGEKIQEQKPNIGKIITTANKFEDSFAPLHFLQKAKQKLSIPFISFAMGPEGMFSRIMCLKYGGYLTFASLEEGKESAQGQINIKDMIKLYESMDAV